jgi:hypothetical protein
MNIKEHNLGDLVLYTYRTRKTLGYISKIDETSKRYIVQWVQSLLEGHNEYVSTETCESIKELKEELDEYLRRA